MGKTKIATEGWSTRVGLDVALLARRHWQDLLTAFIQDVDALLLGRRTYVDTRRSLRAHGLGQSVRGCRKNTVVSKTLEKPIWRDTTIIRDNVVEAVRALKAEPGRNILTDGSSQLVHTLLEHDLVDELHLLVYPLMLGSGKRVLPSGVAQGNEL